LKWKAVLNLAGEYLLKRPELGLGTGAHGDLLVMRSINPRSFMSLTA
jgi:hypothetical protein